MRIAALVLALLTGPAAAQTPAEAAQLASEKLQAASVMLSEATGRSDRIEALTETVLAYEDGLEALRDGLRRASIRERTLAQSLDARSEEVARLLAVLMRMERTPTGVLLLHPDGPTGTARSGMMLADVTPAMQAEVTQLRGQLEEVAILRQLQESAAETLAEGLAGAQEARAELSAAIADRTDLPRRYADDPVQTALLIASAETLEAFASGLTDASVADGAVPAPDARDLMGSLALPVDGTVLRRFGEADAAGITRPGILIATRPGALVMAPSAATLRYAGPLLDYGTVAILEPAPDTLWILSGLSEVFGEVGEVLPGGKPIGLMSGTPPSAQDILTESQSGTGPFLTETLYLEVREGLVSVDPSTWFAFE